MAEFPAPKDGIALTHFIVAADVERSHRFWRISRRFTPSGARAEANSSRRRRTWEQRFAVGQAQR